MSERRDKKSAQLFIPGPPPARRRNLHSLSLAYSKSSTRTLAKSKFVGASLSVPTCDSAAMPETLAA
jgi:hypothetical protein